MRRAPLSAASADVAPPPRSCPRSTSVVSGLSWSSSFSVLGECVYDQCDELTLDQCEADMMASRGVALAVGALSALVALVAALL